MTEAELLSIIAAHEKAAMGNSSAAGLGISSQTTLSGGNMTTLELDNYNALNYYYARPLGNEQPDRSQMVSPELRDTIEWIKPQLMRMFAGTNNIVRFEADGPEDEELADQQTEACNYIFMRQNNGVMVLHDYIMDALLMRNGYIKTYYEKKRSVKIENYTGLDQDALTKLMTDAKEEGDEIEILGQEEKQDFLPNPLALQPPIPGQPPQPPIIPYTCFDIKLRRVSNPGKVCVDAIPREEVVVSPRTRSGLDDSPFYMHKNKRSRSDLIAEGYDKDLVNKAQIGPPRWTNLDDLARNDLLDQSNTDETSDIAMQEPEVREVHMMVDWDGDGIAELRHICIIGDQIAENEEEEEGPLASGSPMRMAHRHIGISIYELLVDLQQEKTMLVRNLNDNIHLANNTRTAVNQDDVNFDDMMTNRPGGLVRTKGDPMAKFFPLETPNVIGDVLTAIEYYDKVRQWRVGVGEDTVTMDPDALQNVTKGSTLAMLSKSDLKIELMARLLAEGLKDTFRKINNAIIRHQDKPMTMKLRGKWVEIDPSQWKYRTSVTINVGLGSGNREETRANLMLLGQGMQTFKQAGLVGPKQAYNYAKRSIEALGFNTPSEFVVDPSTPEGQQLTKSMQPPPPYQVQVAQIKAQSEAADRQQQAQLDQQQSALDHQLAVGQITAQQYAEKQKLMAEQLAETQKMALGHKLAQDQSFLDAVLKLAVAAIQAKAQADTIGQDVQGAERALQ